MKKFNTGIQIYPLEEKLGFNFGNECFFPELEFRKLDAIRKTLYEPDCIGPEIVYAIAMDVGKKVHKQLLEKLHLLFGVVTYAAGKLGNEPVRSQGHIHKKSVYADNWSTPEVYEIWSGEAIIYMQETAQDIPGRCFAVYAFPGDIVIVPPGWAHATISANPLKPLTFGAWCDRDYGFDYDEVRSHKGLAWFPMLDEYNKIFWKHNDMYSNKSDLIVKEPRIYTEFNIIPDISIYHQFEDSNNKFDFVPTPNLFREKWIDFIP
jgi:glucose-6-phosphate isomerase